MNSRLKINLIVSLFIFSCSEDKTQIISNIPPDLPNQNYKINLHSNSGSFLENVTIYWNGTAEVVALYDSGTLINPGGSTYTFNDMIPGEFRDITIQVIGVDSTHVDSIQIFTRPVYPVSNFLYEVEMVMRGNGIYDDGESFTDLDSNNDWNEGEEFIDIENPEYHRILSWSSTIESDETFLNYVIYRADNDNADILINPEYCDCEIATITKSNNSFTDSMVTEESGIFAYYYQIRVNSGIDGRNSYIYNYTNFQSPPQIALAYSNVSKIYNKFIQITWGTVSNSTYFYQYEIWRASEENSDDMQRLVIIIDPEQDKFMDRNVGTGTTYNYSVAVVDINGNRVFSDFVSGWSLP